jgi:acyl-coenzyme A thioesterase PaaI-like protein
MTEQPKNHLPALPAVDESTIVAIRTQVMRAIALNREPGYHFAGNFLDLSYDHVGTDHASLSVDVQSFSSTVDGQLSLSGFAILADLAMAGAVRAGLEPRTRLATVTMNLQFTGARADGRHHRHRERDLAA